MGGRRLEAGGACGVSDTYITPNLPAGGRAPQAAVHATLHPVTARHKPSAALFTAVGGGAVFVWLRK
jgi:hypothetical protein